MAIFSQRSGSVNLQGLLNQVRVDTVPNNGDILVWHEASQSFTVRTPEKISGISNVQSHGAANSHSIVDAIVVDTLYTKEIKEGTGVAIESDNESITIHNSLSANQLSVPDSYEITIDNDASSTNARFEIMTAAVSIASPKYIDFLPTVNPVTVQNVYTDNQVGKGVIRTINGFSFTSAGFLPGQGLLLRNAGAQSGEYRIEDVTTVTAGTDVISTIILTTEFTGDQALDLGGPKIDVEFIQLDFEVLPATASLPAPYDPLLTYTVASVLHDFGPAGHNLLQGMIVHLSGSANGEVDGAYVVDSVVPKGAGPLDLSKVVFKHTTPLPASGHIVPDDIYAPQLRFSVEKFEGTTGFWVQEDGLTHAPQIKVDSVPVDPDDVATKEYVDQNIQRAQTRQSELYFAAFF